MIPTVDIRRTCKAAKVVFPLDDGCLPSFAEPGSIEPKGNYILLACPGCGSVSGMSAGHPKPGASPSWDVVGGSLEDVATLSLSPSINCAGCCGWHGYLTDGVFRPC